MYGIDYSDAAVNVRKYISGVAFFLNHVYLILMFFLIDWLQRQK